MANVLVYGGAFDPIHWGHLNLASTARHKLVVDEGVDYELWFVPSYYDVFGKKDLEKTANHRIEMLKLVLKNEFSMVPNTLICTLEFESSNKMGTYELMNQLKSRFPKYTFKFLMGADAAANIGSWRNSRKLRREFGLVVAPRVIEIRAMWGDKPLMKRTISSSFDWTWDPAAGHVRIQNTSMEEAISSTAVKKLINERKWKALRTMVPASVLKYIRKNGLYMEDSNEPDVKPKPIAGIQKHGQRRFKISERKPHH
jgi:nicotinate-nucleotide adenylyltransferase